MMESNSQHVDRSIFARPDASNALSCQYEISFNDSITGKFAERESGHRIIGQRKRGGGKL